MSSRKKRREPEELDFEVNIVPIIDALTILVAFMLAAGAYISIALLEVGVAAGGTHAASTQQPKIHLTVELRKEGTLLFMIGGQVNKTDTLPANKNGNWDFEHLRGELADAKNKWPDVDTVTVIGHRDIAYEHIVQAMESVRETHEKVSLGGF